MDEIAVTVDGRKLDARRGETVLSVCERNDVYIPTLCHFPGLSEASACRLCLVEITGIRGPTTACTTPVTNGMTIQTDTPRLNKLRKSLLEMFLVERNHFCMFCEKSGDCELQSLAYRYGVDHIPYAFLHPHYELDATNPRIILDPNRCILCRRCVRACAEIAKVGTLGLENRGSGTRIVADLNSTLAESTCNSCGECVKVCPTGAIFDRQTAYMHRTQIVAPFVANLPPADGSPRVKVATEWLAGCSGCHMSFLDLDEGLVALAQHVEITSSPITDLKHPPEVTVGIVEGAVTNSANEEVVRELRARSKVLVALGDCACLGGMPAMRNLVDRDAALQRAYVGAPSVVDGAVPGDPELAEVRAEVVPVDQIVPVEVYVPGCPPAPEAIFHALAALLTGGDPKQPAAKLRFD
jgi:coenzyme F420-reducing hydrogenase gamma subunit/NAD-dependent dihydropyrimidine dehydrogenase PreA subunit